MSKHLNRIDLVTKNNIMSKHIATKINDTRLAIKAFEAELKTASKQDKVTFRRLIKQQNKQLEQQLDQLVNETPAFEPIVKVKPVKVKPVKAIENVNFTVAIKM